MRPINVPVIRKKRPESVVAALHKDEQPPSLQNTMTSSEAKQQNWNDDKERVVLYDIDGWVLPVEFSYHL